ncbi:hypothetical protein [Flagellimonas onchidii]|uniref:hypothetical protein n=1 Tax=Flagellimonas onchidii TaxID=2562684 RepID=UPI0010A63255|nr:hypothetical protein [Allomuricauda onchidii]
MGYYDDQPDPKRRGYDYKGRWIGKEKWERETKNSGGGGILGLLALFVLFGLGYFVSQSSKDCNVFCQINKWATNTTNNILGKEPPKIVQYKKIINTKPGENWIIERYKNEGSSWYQKFCDSTLKIMLCDGAFMNKMILKDSAWGRESDWSYINERLEVYNLNIELVREAYNVLELKQEYPIDK